MDNELLPVTVAIGDLIFDADPNDGTIGISASWGVDLEMDTATFAVLAELLLTAAGAL